MITVYGAHDDLVELDGDLYEEFYYQEDDFYLVTSNGVVLRINYDGEWNIKVKKSPSGLGIQHYPAGSEEAVKHSGNVEYTDVVVIQGDVEWAVGGTNYVSV